MNQYALDYAKWCYENDDKQLKDLKGFDAITITNSFPPECKVSQSRTWSFFIWGCKEMIPYDIYKEFHRGVKSHDLASYRKIYYARQMIAKIE